MVRKEKQQKAETLVHELIGKIDADPEDVQNYYNLGSALVEMQSFPQAEELFRRALSHFTDAKDRDLLTYGLGNVLYAAEFYVEANQEFAKIQDKELKLEAQLMQAQGFYAQKRYQQAFAYALTVSEQAPKNEAALLLLGDALLALGQLDQAQGYYQKVWNLNSQSAPAAFHLGLILMTQGKIQAGQAYFAKAKELDGLYYQKQEGRLADLEKVMQKNQL